ncbi:MAG TPA: hypothetical protein V6D25_14740 [Leptolyngbyaceae cyanobacterium]
MSWKRCLQILQASILHDLELYQSFLSANAKFQTLRDVSSHAS